MTRPEDGLEVEVIGSSPVRADLARLCSIALAAVGVSDGHLAIEFVDADRIARLNSEHRGKEGPTDVLSFPVDADDDPAGPRELGDVVICAEHTADVEEAVVHGTLHLVGFDHETDSGQMLALQAEILRAW